MRPYALFGAPNGLRDVEEESDRVVYIRAVGVKLRDQVRIGKEVIKL